MNRWPEDVPELYDGTVRLRAHRETDLPWMVEMCRDPISNQWMDLPDPYRPADAEAFLRQVIAPGWRAGTARGWAIEATNSDGVSRYAGNVDIRGWPAATIGFVLHPWARGHGVMSRSVRLALTWSFAEVAIESVSWLAQVGNVVSLRVAWAAGLTVHATVPRQLGPPPLSDAWLGTVVRGDQLCPRTSWLTPTVLAGQGVVLRAFVEADIPRIVEACSDARTRHWLTSMPSPYTEDSARAYLHSMPVEEAFARRVVWCIADPASDLLLANISIFDLAGEDRSSAEIGYWTHPDARGRGVMTEALRLVVDHAFAPVTEQGLGLRRLQLLAAAGNSASGHIARRTGFMEVGREREAELLGDGSHDDLLTFDLLASDKRASRSSASPSPGHR